MVRDFPAYLQTIDPATEVPAAGLLTIDPATEVPAADLLPAGSHRATPYLYSDEDIAALLAAAAAALRSPLRVATYRTLVALLAVSGLRVGEAIWLDHERVHTMQLYLHADLTLKERARARTSPPNSTAGRYRPPDPILAFLEGL